MFKREPEGETPSPCLLLALAAGLVLASCGEDRSTLFVDLWGLAAGDLNEDGAQDVLVSHRNTDGMTVMFGRSDN